MIDRRKFLGRSVLSAGSVIFSSALLESCTKYGIPLPGHGSGPEKPPPLFPPLGDSNINWNDAARTVVTTGLEMIPEVGEIIGPLVDIFWPSTTENVWGEIKDEVEALVDQKIEEHVYDTVKEDLAGLNNSIILYRNELKNGNSASILIQWISTRTTFATALPHFQSNGYELPLLGLFAQFANLYLSLLRDAVLFGTSWGRTDADHQQDITDLQSSIKAFSKYTVDTYNTGKANVSAATKPNYTTCEPFFSINRYDRQMTLTVLDFVTTWPYFDATVYPNGTKVVIGREIYSDPKGTIDNSGPIVLPPPPTQPISSVTVWGGDRINAVQVTYPEGGGPGGVTQTKRMGASGGSNQFPKGGVFDLTTFGPILGAGCAAGSIVNGLRFKFSNSYEFPYPIYTGGPGGDEFSFSYPNEILSSIHINGVSDYYNSADCVVFGFKFQQNQNVSLETLQLFYVKSPKEKSAADFAKAFPNAKIPGDFITQDLKAARKAHWDAIEAQAKEIR
jgi:hypothetical protein